MAAPSYASRKLAEKVRWKLLQEAERILDGDDPLARKELLMKMANTLLPRLNEHTGADGDKLFPAPLLNGKSNDSNNSITETTLTEEKN